MAVCPYNARHEVRKAELRYHMSNCPDKARLEPMIIHGKKIISPMKLSHRGRGGGRKIEPKYNFLFKVKVIKIPIVFII